MKILTLENDELLTDESYSEGDIKLKEPSEINEADLINYLGEIAGALVSKNVSIKKIANHLQQSGLKLFSQNEIQSHNKIKIIPNKSPM